MFAIDNAAQTMCVSGMYIYIYKLVPRLLSKDLIEQANNVKLFKG